MNEPLVVSLPGLLGFLPDDQKGVLAALAGLDNDAPRTFDEAAAWLHQEREAVEYQTALILRALMRQILTPDPTALRLAGSFVAEGVSQDLVRPAIHTIHAITPGIRAAQFPTARWNFQVVNLWIGGPRGTTLQAGVRIKDPQGALLSEAATAIQAPGEGADHLQILHWDRLDFPQPGRYILEVWLGALPLHAYTLPVYQSDGSF